MRRDNYQIFEADNLSRIQKGLDLLPQQTFWNGWNERLAGMRLRRDPMEDQDQCVSSQRADGQSGTPDRGIAEGVPRSVMQLPDVREVYVGIPA